MQGWIKLKLETGRDLETAQTNVSVSPRGDFHSGKSECVRDVLFNKASGLGHLVSRARHALKRFEQCFLPGQGFMHCVWADQTKRPATIKETTSYFGRRILSGYATTWWNHQRPNSSCLGYTERMLSRRASFFGGPCKMSVME